MWNTCRWIRIKIGPNITNQRGANPWLFVTQHQNGKKHAIIYKAWKTKLGHSHLPKAWDLACQHCPSLQLQLHAIELTYMNSRRFFLPSTLLEDPQMLRCVAVLAWNAPMSLVLYLLGWQNSPVWDMTRSLPTHIVHWSATPQAMRYVPDKAWQSDISSPVPSVRTEHAVIQHDTALSISNT